jgi:hypothetical protein
MSYLSVCTCSEGCEPRTSPENCPTHASKYSIPPITTTNVPEDAPWVYMNGGLNELL